MRGQVPIKILQNTWFLSLAFGGSFRRNLDMWISRKPLIGLWGFAAQIHVISWRYSKTLLLSSLLDLFFISSTQQSSSDRPFCFHSFLKLFSLNKAFKIIPIGHNISFFHHLQGRSRSPAQSWESTTENKQTKRQTEWSSVACASCFLSRYGPLRCRVADPPWPLRIRLRLTPPRRSNRMQNSSMTRAISPDHSSLLAMYFRWAKERIKLRACSQPRHRSQSTFGAFFWRQRLSAIAGQVRARSLPYLVIFLV